VERLTKKHHKLLSNLAYNRQSLHLEQAIQHLPDNSSPSQWAANYPLLQVFPLSMTMDIFITQIFLPTRAFYLGRTHRFTSITTTTARRH